MRSAIVLCLVMSACATQVAYEKRPGAPDLAPRPGGCHIDFAELGREFKHEHKTMETGTLVWKVSREEASKLGPEGVRARLQAAACQVGLHVVTEIKAYPDTANGGATYEAKGGVIVDDHGDPITKEDAQ